MRRDEVPRERSDGGPGGERTDPARPTASGVAAAWSGFVAALLAAPDVERICAETARRLVDDFGFSRSLVATVDPDRRRLLGRAGYDPSLPDGVIRAMVGLVKIPLDPRDDGRREAAAWSVLQAEQVYLEDVRRYDFRPDETFANTFLVKVMRLEEVLISPLRTPDGVVGFLGVDRRGRPGAIDRPMRDTVLALGSVAGTVLAERGADAVELPAP